jgi:FkbM family methyltransferase
MTARVTAGIVSNCAATVATDRGARDRQPGRFRPDGMLVAHTEMVVNSERGGVQSTGNVIVIPSHVSGLKFLDNLLTSFGDYSRYPIYLVINEYRDEVEPLFQQLLAKFGHLPITLGRLASNSFEFGGLLCAYDQTPYENFFLLPHSCEIVDPKVFEIAFEEYRGRSAAFFLRRQFDGTHFWESHIGKYRREILTTMNFRRFQPRNIYEATYRSEFGLTRQYQMQEPTAFAFNRTTGPTGEIAEKFGKPRLKMATPYLIKWKTHWTAGMLFRSFPKGQKAAYLGCRLRYSVLKTINVATRTRRYLYEGLAALYCGALWSRRYYHWREQLRRHPELIKDRTFVCHSKYNRELIRLFAERGERHVFEHDLDANGLLLDVGAHNGTYADMIFHQYHCRLHCFEPMPEHFEQLSRRFQAEPKVLLHPVGLSDRTYTTTMSVGGLGSSEFGSSSKRRPVQMQDVAEIFATFDREVDVLKINIEGGEYALLQRMLEKDLLRHCKKVLVQFHDHPIASKLARRLRLELIAGIEKTHAPTFSYPFMWEGWQRRT